MHIKYTRFLILLVLNTCRVLDGAGQAIDSIRQVAIIKVAQYREKIIQENPEAALRMQSLLNKWDSLHVQEEERGDLTLNIMLANRIYGLSDKSIKKKAIKYMPESKMAQALTGEDISIISENAELLDLVHLGVLKYQFPFAIDSDTPVFSELQAYGIQSHDTIGEIGAGSGAFSMLLGMVYPDLVIYVNEIDKGFLTYLDKKLARNNALLNPRNLVLTKGGKESTALEGHRLNKIILRNTFHHFKKKPEMLEAIARTLNPQGRLYVLETVRDINPDRRLCKLSMSRGEIIAIIESNGFRLIDQIELKGKLLMTFYAEN